MPAKILDRLISAFVGALSAVGTVWFLNANAPDAPSPESDAAPVKFDRLEVDALLVNKVLCVADPQTKEPTIELRNGSISAKNNVFAEQIGAFRVLGQKLQITPHDPLNMQSQYGAELAITQDGGAYLDLISPKKTHSLVLGFDKTEQGCLVSQNIEDTSMVAQAIFPKPNAGQAVPPAEQEAAPLEQPQDAATPNAEPSEASADALPPFDAAQPPAAQDVAPLPSPADAPLPASGV
ncbi:MAG: hypothetical protein J6K25_00725 [Thermoguttaceae bacterium]|nr:hypothetical protein [Thermoguttaceae bacterium]